MRIRSIASTRSLLTATLLTCLSLPAFAADPSHFDVIGRASARTATAVYTIDKTKDGIRARTALNYVAATSGTVKNEYKTTKDGNFLDGTSTRTDANAQATYATSKAHDALTISVVVDKSPLGRRDLNLKIPSYLVLFPDDPSVWQILLDTAAATPHADNVYYVLVPTVDAKTKDRIEAFTLNPGDDKTGTLDGKPVTLHHFTLKFKDNSLGNLYTGTEGQLMLVDAPAVGAKQVRTGFVLDK